MSAALFIPLKTQTQINNLLPPISHALAALLPVVWMAVFGHLQLSIELIVCAIIVGNLPDIDTGQSRIGRLIKPVSYFIYQQYGHRTVTHSLLAVSLIALLAYIPAYFGLEPWSWWWWPTWYGSHILLDMIIGGTTGVTLCWPWSAEFDIVPLPSGGWIERFITLFLLLVTLWPIFWDIPSPTKWLRESTGNLDYALTDYRNWESTHTIYADIQGTWQDTRQAVEGRFEVERVVGHTFHLRMGNQIIEAGQSQQPIYLRHIVVDQGPARQAAAPAPTPTATPTPIIIPVRIDNVADPNTEILIQIGDRIQQGDLLADLATYRQQIAIWPTPTPYPLPPTPTPGVNPLIDAEAQAQLQIAIVQATAAALEAQPDAQRVQIAQSELNLHSQALQQAQAAYDQVSWKSNISMLPESLALERATNQYDIAVAQATAAAQFDQESVDAANVRLQLAYVRYQQQIATPTPPYIPPTPLPPEPTPDMRPDETLVYSLVSGTVVSIQIVGVVGNSAQVRIDIQTTNYDTPYDTPPGRLAEGLASPPNKFSPYQEELERAQATVLHVIDGDTLTVQFTSGHLDKLRLLDIDTPETVHPSKPTECFGPEASNHTKARLQPGTTIYLETAGRDKYDRLLAYIWTTDGMLYNEELVLAGLAQHNDYGTTHQYTQRIAAAEQSAQAAHVGLWSACPLAMNN